MKKYKVKLTDSVHRHMNRESNWRSSARVSIVLIIFGGFLVFFSSNNSVLLPLKLGGFLVMGVTTLTFMIRYYERRKFNQRYEYEK